MNWLILLLVFFLDLVLVQSVFGMACFVKLHGEPLFQGLGVSPRRFLSWKPERHLKLLRSCCVNHVRGIKFMLSSLIPWS